MNYMKIIFETNKETWIDRFDVPYTARIIVGDKNPPMEQFSAAFAILFNKEGKLLLTLETDRGWDVPGGHIEDGEDLIQALSREVIEEAGVTIKNPKLFAYLQIEMHEMPENYKYPQISAMPFFVADIDSVNEFVPNEEDLDRGFFGEEEGEFKESRVFRSEMLKIIYNKAKEMNGL